jgi:putative membrane protein
MKKFILLAAACALFATPAAAQSLTDKAKSAAETTGVAPILGIAPTTADFVKNAAINDMFEIEAGKLAQQKADAQSKEFANHMVDGHTKTSTELKALVSGGKVQAQMPSGLDDSHRSKLEKLHLLTGDSFDKEYDDMQKAGHKDAVSLFERYAKGGDNPELKAWAAKTLPTLKQHQEMADKLR